MEPSSNILITGESGFLMSALAPSLIGNVIKGYGDIRLKKNYNNLQIVMHFAGPSDELDFKNTSKTATTMINGTINALEVAKTNKAKFVFASSMAATFVENNYGAYKLAMEHYIQDTYDNYLILRIPRVYGGGRKKGLMRKIRDNLVPKHDMQKLVQFIDIHDFIEETINCLSLKNEIYTYKNYRVHTIDEIKKKYSL
ncbi:MAG: hypothetical protein A2404_15965 [Bdellovibrionales bacterium RIFOXYC1_FULL_39_130]|nr:MAG: hypothetical protein A2485_16025 [Bdellovibrionales bacterium RIFOXYC12_FULL_39_17]OFZ49183.1 MAG: hypothetical protein A2404_15965 [Bdellovibrionales bacterium RIFOXYC1_FULL_39_130]HLE09643.1 SDR family oxidoreductase [Bacteriovoracaceae bacterium]